jgi:hypothetical protein
MRSRLASACVFAAAIIIALVGGGGNGPIWP